MASSHRPPNSSRAHISLTIKHELSDAKNYELYSNKQKLHTPLKHAIKARSKTPEESRKRIRHDGIEARCAEMEAAVPEERPPAQAQVNPVIEMGPVFKNVNTSEEQPTTQTKFKPLAAEINIEEETEALGSKYSGLHEAQLGVKVNNTEAQKKSF